MNIMNNYRAIVERLKYANAEQLHLIRRFVERYIDVEDAAEEREAKKDEVC